jgi:hypothetical protein
MLRRLGSGIALLVAVAIGCGDDKTIYVQAPAGPSDAGTQHDAGPAREEDAALPGDDPDTGPDRLSETGLYSDFAARKVAEGILTFAPAYPLWSDGAEKTRYLYLPPGTQIDTKDIDHWVFPVGAKAWKEFRIDGKLVETRLLWKRAAEPGEQSWWKAAYVWTDDGTDAVAKVGGVRNALGTTHDVPSQSDCTLCHGFVKDTIIGFSAIELSVPSGSAGAGANTGKLLTFAKEGLFTKPPTTNFVVPGEGDVRDALAYLHGNCGFCHNAQLEAVTHRPAHFRLLFGDTSPETTGVYTTTFGTKTFHEIGGTTEVIVPGDATKSQAYVRMTSADFNRMPPKGTKVIDSAGSDLIRRWINALPP